MRMKRMILIILISNFTFLFAQNNESLTLNDCIDLAIKNNPTLERSELTVDQMHVNTKKAYSYLYPSVRLSASSSASESGDWEMGWSAGGSVSQNIYQPGMFSGIKQTKATEKMSRINNSDVISQIRESVSNYFYQILASKNLISVYEKNILFSEENLKKIRNMYELGSNTESDVLKAEVQKSTFESQLIQEKQNKLGLTRSLNLLMGRNADVNLSLKESVVRESKIPSIIKAKEFLFKNNPDLLALYKEKQIQQLSLKISRESYLPSLSASYSYSKGESYGVETTNNSISLNAGVTIFNGFNKKNSVEYEKIGLKSVEVKIREKKQILEQMLVQYYTSLETYVKLIKIKEIELKSAKRDLELVTQQYQIGSSTILEQMNAQLSVLNAESALVKSKYSKKIVEVKIQELIY
ncbi:MAG: TolC family protein [Candidatus Marinimicrobia bacterium]|nr:TolC family protein [Candidatus Neomarinimicrobiota bacterium]